jgi:hypothetical protein
MKKGMATDRTERPAKSDSQIALPAHPVWEGYKEPLVVDSTTNLIRKRHLVSASEFQALMGWTTPRSVSRALAAQRIFAMAREGQQYFPAFFGDPAHNRRHLSAVSRALGDLPGGAKFQFLVSRKGSLAGTTPLEALVAGRLRKVLDLAAAYAET